MEILEDCLHLLKETLLGNFIISATSSPAHLFAVRGKQKEALEHFKYTKILPNKGRIFQEQITEYADGDIANIKTFTARSLMFSV